MELKGTSIFVKRQLDEGLSLTLFVVQSLVAKKSTFKKKIVQLCFAYTIGALRPTFILESLKKLQSP